MSYPSEILADNPLLYWRLDDSSGPTAADASPNGRTGTYTGAPSLNQSGLITAGTSVLFTASAYCINAAALNTSTASVEVWFDYSGTPPVGRGFVAGFTEGLNGAVGDKILFIDSGGFINFYVFDGGQKIATGTSVLQAGVYHFVGTIDDAANELKVYQNGTQTGSTVAAASSFAGYTNPNVLCGGDSNAIVGMLGNGPTARRDEFAVYDTALSPSRVLAHYQAGIAAEAPQVLSMQSHVFGHSVW